MTHHQNTLWANESKSLFGGQYNSEKVIGQLVSPDCAFPLASYLEYFEGGHHRLDNFKKLSEFSPNEHFTEPKIGPRKTRFPEADPILIKMKPFNERVHQYLTKASLQMNREKSRTFRYDEESMPYFISKDKKLAYFLQYPHPCIMENMNEIEVENSCGGLKNDHSLNKSKKEGNNDDFSQNWIQLCHYLDIYLDICIRDGRKFTGILKGLDAEMNILLANATSTPKKNEGTNLIYLGLIVIPGQFITSIHASQ